MKYTTMKLNLHVMGLSLLAVAFLTGCEGAKETLGVGTRQVPDEFAVVRNDPLTLPPDFHLRPPQPGAPRPQTVAAEQAARQAVVGDHSPRETNELESYAGAAPESYNDSDKTWLSPAGEPYDKTASPEMIEPSSGDFSKGELAVLTKAGAQRADPNIREDVDSYVRTRPVNETPVVKRIFGLGDTSEPATVVDAPAERERIKTNTERGDPVTTGDTPSYED